MQINAVRLVVAIMVLVAILLIASAISLHQMHPMRITGTESEPDRRWLEEEAQRRQRELAWGKMGFLVAAGVDLTGIALLLAWDRRRRLNSGSLSEQNQSQTKQLTADDVSKADRTSEVCD